jgi:ribose/xylose/arabinose/galactoside ABC-type transport system permease subunit
MEASQATPAESPGSRILQRLRGDATNREPLLLAVIVIIFVLVSFKSSGFISATNIRSILTDSTTVGIIAVGVGMVIICGGIDISVGSTLAATATISGALAQSGTAPVLAVLAGIAAGCLLGAINAILIVGFKIEPIVATLATLGIYRGVLSQATAGRLIGNLPHGFREIGSGKLLGLPNPIWVFLAVTIVAALAMRYTTYGRAIYAIGNNPDAVRLSGVRTARYQASTYVVAGTLAGIVGVLYAARNGTVLPTSGSGVELFAIAAVVVAGVDIFGGRGTVLAIALAAVLLQVVKAAMVAVGVNIAWEEAFVGITILAAVTLFALSHRRKRQHAHG